MIKYLELTAPEESQFRQAKIVSVMVQEGDEVNAGDALFKVASGSSEVELPSRLTGRVVEIIVDEGENISLMTPLVLLETEVEKSTASAPIANGEDQSTAADVAPVEEEPLADREPSADKEPSAEQEPSAQGEPSADKEPSAEGEPSADKEPLAQTKPSANEVPSPDSDAVAAPEKTGETHHKAKSEPSEKSKPANKTGKAKKAEAHQQQSLNLDGEQAESDSQEPPAEPPIPGDSDLPTEQTESSNMSEIKIAVPDIGIDSAKVIEILVKVGDSVAIDDPLLTLESDKASMDVPSTAVGTVTSIDVSTDQDVAEGDIIVTLSGAETSAEPSQAPEPTATNNHADTDAAAEPVADEQASEQQPTTSLVDVLIPDIGGDSAKVIEILVAVGQSVEVDDPLVTLESDKASMDVPSTVAGSIESILIQLDDDASEGMPVVRIHSSQASAASPETAENTEKPATAQQNADEASAAKPSSAAAPVPASTASPGKPAGKSAGKSHASPSVRRFARELGADLSSVVGSGRKGRVTKDDVKAFVKTLLSGGSNAASNASSGAGIPAVPAIDFSKFGEIDVQPLNKIKKLTAANLHRSWLNVPHVTHNDESNISDLEEFRKQLNAEYKAQDRGIKLSPLAFIVKAVVNALQTYPQFNASLEPGGENLILKKYFHIGIAVDTPNGLVVPVIRDADQKSVAEIAQEMGELAGKARDKKLRPADMSGACFTISSLGGIGGTGFTPIVNSPEVAILGVSRSKIEPVWNGEEFEPGMILPLSLSYDHRVIDGAEAARFTRQIAAVLEDVRRLAV